MIHLINTDAITRTHGVALAMNRRHDREYGVRRYPTAALCLRVDGSHIWHLGARSRYCRVARCTH